MGKLSVIAAILAVLYLVVVDASIYRTTTTTTTEIDEEIPSRTSSQSKRQDRLSHCEQFIAQSRPENPQRCCHQLGQIGETTQCRCNALKEIVRKEEEHGQEIQEVMKRAGAIVTHCGMGSPQRCLRNAVSSSS